MAKLEIHGPADEVNRLREHLRDAGGSWTERLLEAVEDGEIIVEGGDRNATLTQTEVEIAANALSVAIENDSDDARVRNYRRLLSNLPSE